MRLRTFIKLLALGLGAGAVLGYQRARRAPRVSGARRSTGLARDLARDPADPVQGFDEIVELQVEPLDVDALSNEDLEAAQDLAGIESSLDQDALDADADAIIGGLGTSDADGLDIEQVARPGDGGDLYGVHTPIAVDRDHPDDDQAFADGQNWLEALETSAIENGATPGRPLDDIIDDEDLLRTPHPSLRRDVPVADFGSGGRRGL